MKSKSLSLLYFVLFSLVFSCGRNNESGRDPNNWAVPNPYGAPFTSINSPYSLNGVGVNQVMQENPCRGGFTGINGLAGQTYAGQRIPIQIPLTNFPSVIPPNDLYVGVTSYGDVAIVVGQAVNQPPLFIGYMCPRSFSPSGQGQLTGIKVGSYTRCLFKPITAATIVFPGGSGRAEFRWMDGGSSLGGRFSFCN